jgi:hypothetical protein
MTSPNSSHTPALLLLAFKFILKVAHFMGACNQGVPPSETALLVDPNRDQVRQGTIAFETLI